MSERAHSGKKPVEKDVNKIAPFTWEEAFPEELEVVRKRRPAGAPVEENLVGLAFSGGGIRSATFGLGVLEGLKDSGLLKKIDYLSTVSGGGYIGAWLSANCWRVAKHRETAEKKAAEEKAQIDGATDATLKTAGEAADVDWLDPGADWKESVRHLRRYSNYLSPVVGFFSADTWSMATIWLRNTILVQTTVILAIALLLLAPRPLFVFFEYWPNVRNWRWTTICLFILGVVGIAANQWRLNRRDDAKLLGSWWAGLTGAVCLAIAWRVAVHYEFEPFAPNPISRGAVWIAPLLVVAGLSLLPFAAKFLHRFRRGENPPKQNNYTQVGVQVLVVLPMMATGFLIAAILWEHSKPGFGELARLDTFGGFLLEAWRHWPFPLLVVFSSLFPLSFCSIRTWRKSWVALLAPFPAILVLHALLCAIMLLLHRWASNGDEGKWLAYVWTPSMVLYAFALTIVVLIGIVGRDSSEGGREWWGRFGAWLGIYGFAWMSINLAAFYGPKWSAILLNENTWNVTIGGGWVGSILAGLFAGKSGSTSGTPGKGTGAKVMELVSAVAPFVFIAGLLLGVSTLLHLIVAINSDLAWSGVAQLRTEHWKLLSGATPRAIWTVFAACFLSFLLLAWRVDINEFGLNAFYRSRLVRCYLGAARFRTGERNPENFTGFDDCDDLPLATLAEPCRTPAGPLHLVNCALNLGGSSDLALHTRHSATFTLTPLRCGSGYLSRDQAGNTQEIGYAPTATFGGPDGQPTLGQAISVSGAAASPNMGYHTSPVVAFMLTLFNVRLGWWFPNPRMAGTGRPSPKFSLHYLIMELFGGADDKSKYLAISDGGHFENLAAYELIRRKCRVIIISDGECDPNLQFEGLGTLIRMCKVDFGAEITIDVGSIRAGESPWSHNRCAVGSIKYAGVSPPGTLIYLKASMTGHEDTSVLQYKATHAAFPHETTGDQFYGEDQFESYRSLGRDIVTRTFEPVRKDEQDFVRLAQKLEKVWSPTLSNAAHFTQHTTRLMDLWYRLGGNPDFGSLDREFTGDWPDETQEGFRSAFYLCSEMIQLMENVYLDLGLEETWDHPDNAGWCAIFKNWASSQAVRKTWALTDKTYGLRFRYFCEDRLGMPISDARRPA